MRNNLDSSWWERKISQVFLSIFLEEQIIGLLKGWIKFEENLSIFRTEVDGKIKSVEKKGLPQYTPSFWNEIEPRISITCRWYVSWLYFYIFIDVLYALLSGLSFRQNSYLFFTFVLSMRWDILWGIHMAINVPLMIDVTATNRNFDMWCSHYHSV